MNFGEVEYHGPVQAKTLDDFATWDQVHAPGSNWLEVTRASGSDAVNAAHERLNEQLVQDFLDDTIPPHDRPFDLRTIQPSDKSRMPLEFQARIIEAMTKQPFEATPSNEVDKIHGWAFFGPAGWSKSTLCTAWFAEYVRQNIIDVDQIRNHRALREMISFPKNQPRPASFVRIDATTLIEEHLNWQHRDFSDKLARQPRMFSAWIEDLRRMSINACLYLEEVDKIRTDKSKLDILFGVVGTLYNYHGTLLLTSNLTKQEFTAEFGPEFARRVSEMCNVVDCFGQEIKTHA